MKKPAKPRKPTKPIEPSKTVPDKLIYKMNNYDSVTLNDVLAKWNLQIEDIDIQELEFYIEHDDYDPESRITYKGLDTPNPFYDEQLKKYKKDKASYDKKLKKYNNKLKIWKEEYKVWQEETEKAEREARRKQFEELKKEFDED